MKRNSADQISISERQVGSKQLQIVLDDNGTRQEEISSQLAESVCISVGTAIQLARLGVYLEKVFGGPRDLEFAVVGKNLYLLQARPITALDSWTEREICHEFDTPILTEEDYVTKANTGEVAP